MSINYSLIGRFNVDMRKNSGTDLDEIIPPTSRRKGARELKKHQILVKVQHLVEIYKGI